MIDYLYSIEIDGKLSRKQHQEEKTVQDHKWLQILLLSEKFHKSFYKPNTFRITFDILDICLLFVSLPRKMLQSLPNMRVPVGSPTTYMVSTPMAVMGTVRPDNHPLCCGCVISATKIWMFGEYPAAANPAKNLPTSIIPKF